MAWKGSGGRIRNKKEKKRRKKKEEWPTDNHEVKGNTPLGFPGLGFCLKRLKGERKEEGEMEMSVGEKGWIRGVAGTHCNTASCGSRGLPFRSLPIAIIG